MREQTEKCVALETGRMGPSSARRLHRQLAALPEYELVLLGRRVGYFIPMVNSG
jgi:hypothetical protein